MAVEKPLWQRYLEENAKPPISKSKGIFGAQLGYLNTPTPTTIGTRPIEDEDFARVVEKDVKSQIAAEAVGVEPTGKPSKGIIGKAFDVLTFLGSTASSGVKEFIYDPWKTKLVQLDVALQEAAGGLTPEERKARLAQAEDVSIQEFRKNVAERNFAQELFPQLAYEKDAPWWEKAQKEVAGLAIDIGATGGTGAGLKFASVLGRKAQTLTLGNAAKDQFARFAKRNADESEKAFIARGEDFAARAATASLTRRSRGVREIFEEEFGEDVGKKAFQELPQAVKGGLQVGLPLKVVGNINAGGYMVDAVARNLGLKFLPKATDWAVKGYQNTKNILRADMIKSPIVAATVGKINTLLNNVGIESKVWSDYVKTVANKAADDDIAVAYKAFDNGVKAVRDMRNLRGVIVQETNDLFKEVARVRKTDKVAYDKAIELSKNPAALANFVPVNPSEQKALNLAKSVRADYERYITSLKDEGFDVGYLDNYLPLLYVQGRDKDKMAQILSAGPRNIPGKGYDPTKARKTFMKDQYDEATGQTIKVPMTPSEIKDMFIREGRKDLADMIEDDPFVLLARYSTNVSRLLASKKIVQEMVQKGILLRSDTPQLNIDQARLQQIISDPSVLRPKDLDDFMTKVLAEPDMLGNYIESLNDDLIRAYQLNDDAIKKDINERIDTILTSMEGLGIKLRNYQDRLKTQLKKAEERGDTDAVALIKQKIAEAGQSREFLLGQRAGLGQRTGVAGESGTLAQKLAQRSGIDYVPVGGTIDETFYLPDEFARLHSTEQMSELIERTLLLRRQDKKAVSEVMSSIDMYMQFFRTGATFGRLTGFVLRNGYGAVQNNFVIAGSTVADHKVAKDIAKTRIYTEYGLKPLAQLTRADKARGRLTKLAKDGKLTDDQVTRMSADIDNFGFVQTNTVRDVQEEIMENVLSKKKVTDDITQWDVYTAGKEAGIYDKYVVLPASQGLDADDAAVAFLNTDPERIVVRTDKAGKERSWTQRALESVLNVGADISADVAGRQLRLRPVQLTRDLNENMEEFVRLAPIATGLRKYGNTENGRKSAGLLMKAAQFDYSNLTDVERRIFRRVLPFYTFSRNNVPAQLRALMNDPERIRRNLAGWEAVGNVFADENGENYVLPDYIGEMYGFVIDDDIRKAILKDKPAWLQGVLASPYAFRPETPVLEIERWTRGGIDESFQEFVGSSNPLAKSIAQVVLNQNLFSGQRYSAEGVEAPVWAKGIDKTLSTLTGGSVDLGIRKNDRTGKDVMDGRILDIFTTMIPQIGTLDRTAAPLIEIAINAATGQELDLSKYDNRAVSNLISQFGGVNIATLTPESEQSELYSRMQRRRENIAKVAGDYNISRDKLNEYISTLYEQGLTREEIINLVEAARERGELAPDPVSGD